MGALLGDIITTLKEPLNVIPVDRVTAFQSEMKINIQFNQALVNETIDLIKAAFKDEFEGFSVELICPMAESKKVGESSIDFGSIIEDETQRIVASIESSANAAPQKAEKKEDDIILGKGIIKQMSMPIAELSIELGNVVVTGEVFFLDTRDLKTGKKLITFNITDGTSSISIKIFSEPNKAADILGKLKKGIYATVQGRVNYDTFAKENVIMATSIIRGKKKEKMDNAKEKRVELHAHTLMSNMDGLVSGEALVNTAVRWGHRAIAITDHGVVQAFPEVMKAAKGKDIKIVYGVEAYLVDEKNSTSVYGLKGRQAIENTTFVVFDLETTGLNPNMSNITEIGAVKVNDGKVIETWSTFVDPQMRIPDKIVELTGITDEMVKGAPKIGEALKDFFEFCNGCVLVAHNTAFDCSFIKIKSKENGMKFDFAYADTLIIARNLYPYFKNFRLNTIAKHFKVLLENHHRAIDDAMATAKIFIIMLDEIIKRGVSDLSEINAALISKEAIIKQRSNHVILLVQSQTGMKNLYKLISKSHLDYFYRKPIMPKSLIQAHREGIIVGSACEGGELYGAILDGKNEEQIDQISSFYDYYEIQPLGNNQFLIDKGSVHGKKDLQEINMKIVNLGKKHNKLTVATGDVHFLNPGDEIFRRILMAGQGFSDADNQAPLYMRTTDEMLAEFAYMSSELAHEVVITNPNKLVDMIDENITPISKEMCPPKIEGSEQDIEEMTMKKAKSIYGNPLPKIVADRIEKELNSIIKNGFAVMYMIAHKLVKKSLDDGYLVGSRGSVGSSLVAYLTDITEVNSLCAHYVCPECKHSEFFDDGRGISGCDLPPKKCPECGADLKRDGHDVPFETFLGFDGDKEPDIDLNFSSDYQAIAHKYTEELFGQGQTFKAGTIGTIAEKTAYGYILNYFEEKGITLPKAEMERLVQGCTGVRRTTGQHPGGIIVVPHGREIYEFCPVQHPADDNTTDIITTHFDYHSIDQNLLKLDILGHDDPTVIKMLEDLTGLDAKTIDIGDKKTMSLFTSTEALGVTQYDIMSKVGTFGVPEFGTGFVRQMLVETKPETFSELVRISGLSHGTDVWTNNAQDLIKNEITTLKGAICTRDDIMIYLIHMGLDPKHSFFIMEAVRKGKGLKSEDESEMHKHKVPDWYIKSCKTIKYMFPKAHAVAYVTMAFRIAFFKVHYAKEFYAAYFSIRADDFDYEKMGLGREKALSAMKELDGRQEISGLTAKEKGVYTILQMCNEMYARGLSFLPISLYKSDSTKFIIEEEGILPPLNSIQGLGINAARSIVEERKIKEFFSKDELLQRTKITKTNMEVLDRCGCLDGMSRSSQMSFF